MLKPEFVDPRFDPSPVFDPVDPKDDPKELEELEDEPPKGFRAA